MLAGAETMPSTLDTGPMSTTLARPVTNATIAMYDTEDVYRATNRAGFFYLQTFLLFFFAVLAFVVNLTYLVQVGLILCKRCF